MTITEFLLARIAEDEDVAREVAFAGEWTSHPEETGQPIRAGSSRIATCALSVMPHIARHDPARVLAECEAKRRIVEWASMAAAKCPEDDWPDDPSDGIEWAPMSDLGRHFLRTLAAVYASHPDYDQAWSL